jgi:NADH-quinone oxidoreductase subunit E
VLADRVRAEIQEHLAHARHPTAASVEALHVVQRHEGYVSDEHLREVAALLGTSPEALDEVASFYNLVYRRPVGRHVVLLCDSVSCWVTGCGRVRAALERELGVTYGQISADGEFTLLPMACLGDCDHAPVLMIGEDTHRDVDPADVAALLARYRGR